MTTNSDMDNHEDRDLDGLDELLGAWHDDVDRRAEALRHHVLESSGAADPSDRTQIPGRIQMNSYLRYLPFAAIIGIAIVFAFLATPQFTKPSFAQDGVAMLPDGGRLDAFDENGDEIGPCALEHTDVHAFVSGHIVRVDVEQVFGNPYETPIEAVYTFPLSHRGAVDRMRMTIRSDGEERIIDGEIEEREQARQMYEEARDAGYVASLLEQERPNIFTQSVANIEPNAEIIISISYVETLEEIDGEYTLVFPTVVGPRYIPGYPAGGIQLPEGCIARDGIVLRGPAQMTPQGEGNIVVDSDVRKLEEAVPIERPDWNPGDEEPILNMAFKVTYVDGSVEPGAFFANNTGVVGGRWFCWQQPDPGAPFSPGTDQVPDASKITPMPVRPGTRAGHDISITVEIETGGAEIKQVDAPLHEINEIAPTMGKGSKGRKVFELASKAEIPNRDFVLEWSLGNDGIDESILVHAEAGKDGLVDGHIAIILNPPPRVEDVDVPARELVFVLDTSGSMRGFPIEKAKAVMTKAIDAMRPEDTFNLITFAGDTHILWDAPRPATRENRELATKFLANREGGGGTEMMKAIRAALVQGPGAGSRLDGTELANLPADGRSVRIRIAYAQLADGALRITEELSIPVETSIALPETPGTEGLEVDLDGKWITKEGKRVLVLDKASFVESDDANDAPMRIVVFMSDGYVGNDQAMISEVRKNADTTRVFSFGIGNSVNRYLLDGMAEAGRGAVEYVLLNDKADEAVDRLARRIETPVLIDVSMEFEGIELLDVLPSGKNLPDLYDEKPIVILARYEKPGDGTITLRGRTGSGAWSREVPISLPAEVEAHDVVATLWARAMVDEILNPHLAQLQMGLVDESVEERIVALGKAHSIMTPFTSFVAIEKTRVVSDGKPMLVRIPIELPSGTDWAGFFGNPEADPVDASLEGLVLGLQPEPVENQMLLEGSREMDLEVAIDSRNPIPPPTRDMGRSPSSAAAVPAAIGSTSVSSGSNRHFYFGRGGGGGGSLGLSTNSLNLGTPAPPSRARGRSRSGGGRTTKQSGGEERWYGNSDEFQPDTESDVTTGDEAEAEDANPRYLEPEQFQHLARVLERPLFRLAVRSLLPEDLASNIMLTKEEGLLDEQGRILVSIKVADTDRDMLDSLAGAGFIVSGTNSDDGILVGSATPKELADIGLIDGVLRIVHTRMDRPDGTK